MRNHEYAILGGINRSHVGRYVAVVSASITSFITFFLLLAFDLASKFGLPANVPPILLSLLLAGIVFWLLYFFFSKIAWRWGWLGKVLLVADLSGDWNCSGRTLNVDGSTQHEWNGVITIAQDWDKIRVRLKTEQSESFSVAAAFILEGSEGYRLLYHYHNQPRIGEPEIAWHRGFCDLLFSRDLKSAEGDYFNGFGRYTFGRLDLVRVSND